MLLDVLDQNFSEQQQLAIRKTAAHLMRVQFYHSESATNTYVNTVMASERCCEFLRQSFHFLGYKFIVDQQFGYCGIVPTDEITVSGSMTEADTFVVLALRHMYDKCFDLGDIDEAGNVETSFNDFADEIAGITSPTGWSMSTADLRARLTKIAGMNIVAIDAKVGEEGDIPMKIRPFIRQVITFEALARIESFIRRKNGEPDDGTIEIVPDNDNGDIQE